MKLLIAEKILQYRKKKNMTQDDLAKAIGVSAQAVSGWERNCGYPDITLLPGIAHTLGITIDELMGNDEISVQEDIDQFYKKLWNVDEHEKLKMSIEYYRKYPEIYDLADTLIMVLADWGFANEPEYLDLLREAAEKVIENCTDNDIRHHAIAAMSRWGNEEETERWLGMIPKPYSYVRGEVYEEHLWNHGQIDAAQRQQYANNLSLMLHIIGRPSNHSGNPERSIEHNEYLRRLIHTFGEENRVPDGWMGKYAFITLRNAAGLFGAGKIEEGFVLLTEAKEAYEKLFSLPDDTPLDLGNPGFFGDIAVVQHRDAGQYDTFVDGKGAELPISEGFYYTQNMPEFHHILTGHPGWAWLDPVRNDPRFLAVVDWAKTQKEIWEEKHGK